MDKLSYALGLGIGQQLAQMGADNISAEDFAQAINDVLKGNELKVSHREAQTIVQDYFQKQEQKLQAERAEKGKAHKEAGEKFLRLRIPLCATMRVHSSTVLYSIAHTSVASPLHSHSSRLSLVGPRVCSSCRRVPSIVSSSLTVWLMARVVQVLLFLHSQHSFSMLS